MILTRSFVFLNHPKTGSTFTRKVIEELEEKRNNSKFRYAVSRKKWSVLKVVSALGIYRLPYLELHHPPLWSKLDHADQHGGASQVPIGYRHLPHATIARDPRELSVSHYEFSLWKEKPQVPEKLLNKKLPSFPDLSFGEYLRYEKMRANLMIQEAGVSPKSKMGFHTIRYIRTLFRNPKYVLENFSEGFIKTGEYLELLPDIKIIDNRNLNKELFEFVTSNGYDEEKASFILGRERIYPPEGGRKEHNDNWKNYYSKDTKKMVQKRERLLFILLNRLGVEY